MTSFRAIGAAFVISVSATSAHALSVTGGVGAADLATALLAENTGVVIVSSSLSGDSRGAGTFTDGDVIDISEGVILATGDVTDA